MFDIIVVGICHCIPVIITVQEVHAWIIRILRDRECAEPMLFNPINDVPSPSCPCRGFKVRNAEHGGRHQSNSEVLSRYNPNTGVLDYKAVLVGFEMNMLNGTAYLMGTVSHLSKTVGRNIPTW
jgi:hypothetical protein